jgi:hypothetical protein
MLLGIMLAVSAVFAAWSWFRPYEWQADPGAGGRVVAAEVTRDHSFFWVHVHVRVLPGTEHDLRTPVRLHTAGGRELEPAETTLGGSAGQPISELWLKFWLEEQDWTGPLELQMNEGKLRVRSGSGVPPLGSSGRKNFTTNRW